MVIDLNQREWFPRKRIQATICSASRSLPHGPLAAGFFNLPGIGEAFRYPTRCLVRAAGLQIT